MRRENVGMLASFQVNKNNLHAWNWREHKMKESRVTPNFGTWETVNADVTDRGKRGQRQVILGKTWGQLQAGRLWLQWHARVSCPAGIMRHVTETEETGQGGVCMIFQTFANYTQTNTKQSHICNYHYHDVLAQGNSTKIFKIKISSRPERT